MIHIWRPWKLSNFQDPHTPSYPSTSKILPPPWPWTSNFKWTSPPISNESLTVCLFVALYFCVCSCPKISRTVFFIYILLIFWVLIFCNQPVLFAQLENVNKLWKSNRTVQVHKRNQSKNETKSCHIQIDHAFCCSVYVTNNAVVSIKDGFTTWRQSKRKISCQ